MKKVKMSAFVEDGVMSVRMNDDMVLPGNGGETEFKLLEGKKYFLNWYIEGASKSKFNISISSPQEARFNLKKELSKEGSEFGFYEFEL